MLKYVLTLLVLFGIAALLLVYNRQPVVAEQPETALTRYQPPAQLPVATRPQITVDENLNKRWVKTLEQSSLRGTDVDRAIILQNDDGSLQLTPGILVYFDYFLSLRGEMAMQRIMQLVFDDLQANYPPAIAAQLYDLFERYLNYSDAIDDFLKELTHDDVVAQGITGQGIEQRFQPRFFTDEEIDALFIAYKDMLDFTPKAKDFGKKLQQYQNTAPEYRFAMATELFGAEAAGRLRLREEQRQQWQQRLLDYQQQKEVILAAGLDQHNQQAAIADLRDRLFNPHEQVRLKTWENNTQ